LILGEQHYFVWKNASQSTKWLYFLNIWGRHGPFGPPPGYAYGGVWWSVLLDVRCL